MLIIHNSGFMLSALCLERHTQCGRDLNLSEEFCLSFFAESGRDLLWGVFLGKVFGVKFLANICGAGHNLNGTIS